MTQAQLNEAITEAHDALEEIDDSKSREKMRELEGAHEIALIKLAALLKLQAETLIVATVNISGAGLINTVSWDKGAAVNIGDVVEVRIRRRFGE